MKSRRNKPFLGGHIFYDPLLVNSATSQYRTFEQLGVLSENDTFSFVQVRTIKFWKRLLVNVSTSSVYDTDLITFFVYEDLEQHWVGQHFDLNFITVDNSRILKLFKKLSIDMVVRYIFPRTSWVPRVLLHFYLAGRSMDERTVDSGNRIFVMG